MPQAIRSNIIPDIHRPIRVPKALREQLNAALEAHLAAQHAHGAAIDALLALKDRAGGDPDLEETGDKEPALGGGAGGDDRELDTADEEPSLTHTNDFNQAQAVRNATGHIGDERNWFGKGLDLEVEHDGREPDLESGDEDSYRGVL